MNLRLRLVLLPLFCLTALAACNDDAGSPAGQAGAAGVAGEAGQGGEAGRGGEAGDAGAAGEGDAGQGGGASGQGGEAGAAGEPAAGGQGGGGGSESGASGQAGGGGVAGGEAGAGGQAGGGAGMAGGGGAAGACAPGGEPACGDGQTCLGTSHDGAQGQCTKSGTKPSGAACNPKLVHTGCAAGMVCAVEPHGDHAHPTCRPTCALLAADPGCPGAALCTAGYLIDDFTAACLPDHAWAQAVAVGQPCGAGSYAGDPCGGLAGVKYEGSCAADDPASAQGPLTCRRLCAVSGAGCGAAEACRPLLDLGTLGVCVPAGE